MAVALLLRTPNPEQDESLFGYVLRVSEANGYETPWHVLDHAGYSQGEMLTASFDPAKLAAVLAKSPEALRPNAYMVSGRKSECVYGLLGVPIGRGLAHQPFRFRTPAVCRHCVDGRGYASACWDLSAFVACPEHETWLVQSCENCNSPLSFYRPGLLVCRCGSELSPRSEEPPSRQVLALMSLIAIKVAGKALPTGTCLESLPAHWRNGVTLDRLLRLIPLLARLAGAHREVRHRDVRVGVAAAAEVLADWPNGFHALLRRMAAAEADSKSASLSLFKRFKALTDTLLKPQTSAEDLDVFRDEFLRFGMHEWGEGLVDPRSRGASSAEARFTSANQLARRIGVMPVTVVRWVEEGLVAGKVASAGNVRKYMVDAAGATETGRSIGRFIQEREAAKLLGVPVVALSGLKKTGHYSMSAFVNAKTGYNKMHLIELRRRLLDAAPRVQGSTETAGEITLGEVLQSSKFGSEDAKAELLARILTKQLVPVGRTGPHISDLVLSREDVKAFRLAVQVDSNGELISAAAAARIIGCAVHEIEGLVSAGHLQRARSAGAGLNRSSVESFAREWLSLSAVARSKQTTSKAVSCFARSLGLQMKKVSIRDRNAGYYIPRSEAERLEAAMADGGEPPKDGSFGGEHHYRYRGVLLRRARAEHRLTSAEKLNVYLNALRASDELLPRRGRELNLSAIATAVGVDRSTLGSNPKLWQLVVDRSMEEEGSGRATSVSPLEALQSFLSECARGARRLPTIGGAPNLAAISRHCGFGRNEWYKQRQLIDALEASLRTNVQREA